MISVVLPVLNGMPWLEDQLRALTAQKCDEPWEVIVADNGSTDGSRALALRWADEHDRFQMIDASSEHGARAARNCGVRAASGELLAFCDADDVVHAGWVTACAAALQRADLVAGVFDFWSLNGLPASRSVPAAFRQLGFLPAGLGANLAVRRTAFEAVGGFSGDVVPGEDIDLCWRLQLKGFRFQIDSNAVVSKRMPSQFDEAFHQALSYGRTTPVLFRRYRSAGAHRDLIGALKSWAWLALSVPWLSRRARRIAWARTAGVRIGRLAGSLRERVFFP